MVNSDVFAGTHPSIPVGRGWEWYVQMGCLVPCLLPHSQVSKKGEGGILLLGGFANFNEASSPTVSR